MYSLQITLDDKMTNRRLIQINPETGEEIDGFVAYVAPKKINGFGQRWMAMAQNAIQRVALDPNLTGEDLRVFNFLVGEVDFENLLVVNQAEIARKMGWQRQNIQRSIKRLIVVGVLLEGPKIGINRSYRFNPEFGWKGTAKNHVTALKDERSKRMKAAGISGVIDGGKPHQSEVSEPSVRDDQTLDMFPGLLEEATV